MTYFDDETDKTKIEMVLLTAPGMDNQAVVAYDEENQMFGDRKPAANVYCQNSAQKRLW